MMELLCSNTFKNIEFGFYKCNEGKLFVKHKDLSHTLGFVYSSAIESIIQRNQEVLFLLDDNIRFIEFENENAIFLSLYNTNEITTLSKSHNSLEFKKFLIESVYSIERGVLNG